MSEKLQVLIVGAGIAGVATAVALQQKGFMPDIIEKSSHLNKGVGGLLLSSNATESASKLGIDDALASCAFEIDKINYRNHKNKTLTDFDTKHHFAAEKPFYAVHRNVLLTALASKLTPNTIGFEKSMVSMENSSTGVDVTFNDGSQKHYDLVIAADGINSSTRTQIFGEKTLEDSELSCIRLVVKRPTTLQAATYMLGKGKAVALLPIDDELAYCPFVFCSSLLQELEGKNTRDVLKHLYQEFQGEVPEVIKSGLANEASPFMMPLKSINLETWHKERVLLVGDAAHALIPTQPQGAGMAMEDALILAETLSNNNSLDESLALYQQRRYHRVAKVQNTGYQRIKAIKLGQSAIGNFLSQAVMKLVGQRKLRDDWSAIIDDKP